MRPVSARHAWLSITPEPESELPRALAMLRHGGPPPRDLVDLERRRAERLVTRGSRRAWRGYLGEAASLARSAGADAELLEARALVEQVIENHENLALGLSRRKPSGRDIGEPA